MDHDGSLQELLQKVSVRSEALEKEHKSYKQRNELLLKKNQSLSKENKLLKDELLVKDQRIEELEKQFKASSRKNQDYNKLNSRLNEVIRESEKLKSELEQHKYKKRTPLAAINIENSEDTNILNMLKKSAVTNTPKKPSKSQSAKQIRQSDTGLIIHSVQAPMTGHFSSSQNQDQRSESSDLAPTQFTMEGDESEANRPVFQKPHYHYDESFDPKDNIPIMEESIDLRAPCIEVPFSSPVVKHESMSQDLDELQSSPMKRKSPVKVKKEEVDSFEVLDSQEELDDHLDARFPTPKTTTKFQTPLNIPKKFDFKKSMLHTPDEITPMKNPKRSRKTLLPSTNESIPSRGALTTITTLDLTINPDKNHEWVAEDFKIDPSKNDGYDHAYDVVLRGDKRKCIHGKSCKDCDKFYKVAQGDKIKPSFIGPQWNKESAQAQQHISMVSKTSRHRSVWDRPASPPGFGDFDFPDTQQQKINREKSNKFKRQKAYQRLYSALNNGQYMFKDDKYNEAVKNGNFTIDETVFERYINIEI